MSGNNLWINKYKPNNLNQIIGNIKQIEEFKNWIINLPTKKNQSIIISGNQGIGKTLIIKLILKELNYMMRIINPNDIKDYRICDDINDYNNFNNSILNKIKINNNDNNNKIAIIFDETENITLLSEKKYVQDIYKNNNKTKSFPLIFISNNRHSKLLNDLKKYCYEIIFEPPSKEDLLILTKRICLMENIFWESNESIEKIIEFSQYDIRRLINLLQELSYHLDNNKITNNCVYNFIKSSKLKNIDIGLFESTDKILNYYLDYETIIKLYESEKVLLPLMIHENYIKKILVNNNKPFNDIIKNMVKITDSMSIGDNIETSIYTDQNWYLQNIHGFFSCLNTSYWINDTNSNIIKYSDIKFSSDLNKTSLKNINKKNISNLSKIINNKSTQEILMLNNICNYLIKNNREKELINILNGYNKNITIKDIELCLKIDKTTDFNILGTKDKKRISKQIND